MDEGSRRGIAGTARPSVFLADEQSDGEPLPLSTLERLRRLASFVLAEQRVPAAMEVSFLFVDASDIERLNAHHMGEDGPTDVLAFPLDAPGETTQGEPAILGDVVVCPTVATRQAAERDVPASDELELLVVHGLLHLLGHDHAVPDERAEMFALTDRLLAEFRADAGRLA